MNSLVNTQRLGSTHLYVFCFFSLLLVKGSGEREVEGERFHVGRKENDNSSTLRSFEKKLRNNVLRHLNDSKSSILSISL